MKHVLIVDAGYLSTLFLNALRVGQSRVSDLPKEGPLAKINTDRSNNGLNVYRANEESLATQIDALNAAGQPLDGVVIFDRPETNSKTVLEAVARVKAQRPECKVLAVVPGVVLDERTHEIVQPHYVSLTNVQMREALTGHKVITPESGKGMVAEGVDQVAVGLHGDALASALRVMVGMRPVAQQSSRRAR